MHTECDHMFCNTCIRGWLQKEVLCPLDRQEIQVDQLRPAPRFCRSRLGSLKIRCSFESYGCTAVIQLDDLAVHEQRCEDNPNYEWPCQDCETLLKKVTVSSHSCVESLKARLERQEQEHATMVQEILLVNDQLRAEISDKNLAIRTLQQDHVKLRAELIDSQNKGLLIVPMQGKRSAGHLTDPRLDPKRQERSLPMPPGLLRGAQKALVSSDNLQRRLDQPSTSQSIATLCGFDDPIDATTGSTSAITSATPTEGVAGSSRIIFNPYKGRFGQPCPAPPMPTSFPTRRWLLQHRMKYSGEPSTGKGIPVPPDSTPTSSVKPVEDIEKEIALSVAMMEYRTKALRTGSGNTSGSNLTPTFFPPPMPSTSCSLQPQPSGYSVVQDLTKAIDNAQYQQHYPSHINVVSEARPMPLTTSFRRKRQRRFASIIQVDSTNVSSSDSEESEQEDHYSK